MASAKIRNWIFIIIVFLLGLKIIDWFVSPYISNLKNMPGMAALPELYATLQTWLTYIAVFFLVIFILMYMASRRADRKYYK